MRVAVTGGTGFIGRHLVAALAAAGHEVTVVARQPATVPGAARVIAGDVTRREIGAALAGAATIVHLAALADASRSAADPVGYTTVNALGTLNVLDAACVQGAGVVFASSQRVYVPWHGPLREDGPRDPTTVYGWSKLAAEGWVTMYGRLYDVPAVTLRLFSVYGPGQRATGGVSGVVAIFGERALRGQDLTVHQRHLRDFVYVTDVAAAFVKATERVREPGVRGGFSISAPASGRRSTTWRAWCETGAGWRSELRFRSRTPPPSAARRSTRRPRWRVTRSASLPPSRCRRESPATWTGCARNWPTGWRGERHASSTDTAKARPTPAQLRDRLAVPRPEGLELYLDARDLAPDDWLPRLRAIMAAAPPAGADFVYIVEGQSARSTARSST